MMKLTAPAPHEQAEAEAMPASNAGAKREHGSNSSQYPNNQAVDDRVYVHYSYLQ